MTAISGLEETEILVRKSAHKLELCILLESPVTVREARRAIKTALEKKRLLRGAGLANQKAKEGQQLFSSL